MEQVNRVETEKSEAWAKLENLIDKGKQVCERLQDQTAAAAKTTDKTIREHPYQVAGIAFGVGLLVGVLVMRSRSD